MAVAVDGISQEHSIPGGSRLRAVDVLLLGYLALVSVVAAIREHGGPAFWWLLLAHTLFVLLLYLLTRPGLGLVGRSMRELYPLFLLPALYGELDILNSPAMGVHDVLVRRWELFVFGAQVSREWWQAAPSVFWSTVFHSAYLSYYLIVSAPALYFAWKGDLAAVRRFVLVVITTFVVCYLFFIFFPVAGPYYEFPRPAAWFIANLPAQLAYEALARGSSYGAAFPSSHVAAAFAATTAAMQASRKLGFLLLVPTALLTVGVVYCQMHYGVDALAGLFVGAIVAGLLHRAEPDTGRPSRHNAGGSELA